MTLIHQALRAAFKRLRARKLPPVTVAVVDSGVDSSHPDLRGRVTGAWRIAPYRDTHRAMPCPVGRDNDVFGHGTAVAGIVADIAPNARIMDFRVFGADRIGSGAALLAGFRTAIERGARLINLSLACLGSFAGELHELCEQAYRNNQIVVAAKRNMPLEDNGWPAELSSCISVDRANFPSPFLLRFLSPPIEFAARGEQVVAPKRGGGYAAVTGTSFATPTVTGLCALLIGAFPDLRLFEIKTLLKDFAAGKARRQHRGS